MFKTVAIGGFNKSDVLTYIDKQGAAFKKREEELISLLDRKNAELKEAKDHSQPISQRADELEEKLKTVQEKNAELERQAVQAVKEAESIKQRFDQKNSEIDKLRHDLMQLRQDENNRAERLVSADQRLDEQKEYISELESRLANAGKNEEQIAKVMLEAQNAADHIVASANEKADKILGDARSEAESLTAATQLKTSDTLKSAADRIADLVAGAEEYRLSVSQAKEQAHTVFESIDRLMDTLAKDAADVAENYADIFSDEINKPDEEQEPDELEGQEEIQMPENETESVSGPVKFDFTSGN